MRETARAVAALLDLRAVRVVDTIVEVGARIARCLDQQDLVAADAEAPIGYEADLCGVQRECLAGGVEHHEIVAQAVHFGEGETHPGGHPWAR